MTFIAKIINGSAKAILRSRSTLKLLNFKKSTVKDQSKLKISATRKLGFEAEIGDLYIGENGSAT
jgi:hypothetical protein